jgi:hypothetical protein
MANDTVPAVTPQHTSPISILLSFVLLVVLINCMDVSRGRVTTALSVHGTTVIHQGWLVNDISSAVDQQGRVYISGADSHDIHRLSPDGTLRDIVLSKHDVEE